MQSRPLTDERGNTAPVEGQANTRAGEAARSEPAITLYRARRIHTLTADTPEALAVHGGRIVATGGLGELRERYPRASVIDYGDAVIVPGFNDSHMHLMS